MLPYVSAARLAFNHSPLRERRLACFASTPGMSTSGAPERNDEQRSYGELADEIRRRLEEFTTLLREGDYLRNANIDQIWKTVETSQDTIRADLAIVLDESRAEDERFAALLRAEKQTAEVEESFASGSDESVIRRRINDVVPSLTLRPELNNDTEQGQAKLQEIREKRDTALRLLEAAAGPAVSADDRRKALAEAAAIVQGLKSVNEDAEKERMDTIISVIHDTRAKLKELLPQVQALPDFRDDNILGKEFLDAGTIIGDINTRTQALLNETEDRYKVLKKNQEKQKTLDEKESRNLQMNADVARSRVVKLQAFLDHILQGRKEPKKFTMEEWYALEENKDIKGPIKVIDPRTGKERDLKVNGYYDERNKTIALNADLSPEEAMQKTLHEQRHLALHALKGLDENALLRLYNTVKDAKDADGKTITQLLLELNQGKRQMPAYQLYGVNHFAAFEELLVRAADEKAGIQTLDPREQHILALFRKNRPKTETEPAVDAGGNEPQQKKYSTEDNTAAVEAEEEVGKNVEKEKKVPLTARQLSEKVHEQEGKVRKTCDKLKEVDGIIDNIPQLEEREKLKDKWKAHRKILEDCLITMSGYHKFLDAADQWKGGELEPKQLEDLLNSLFLNKKSGDAGAIRVGDDAFQNRWLTVGNKSARMEMANEFPLDEELKAVQNHVELLEKELPKVEDNLIELKTLEKSSANPAKKGILGTLGLEFYSINQIIESTKNVFESFSKAWSNWSQLKVSKLSNAMGKAAGAVLPFGDQAAISLEMELDHKNDEIKDGYKKHLEHDLASFDHCFDEHHTAHSLFHMNLDDPNRFRGTLEYMASNGWLYKIDGIAGTVFDVHIEQFLPATWPKQRKEMYIRDLEQQNSDGEEKASKKGLSRVDTYPDIPPMMQVLQDELKRHNFWAVKGILERAIQKGKTGETSTWASSLILHAIRHDSITRQYFPKGLMDQLGNIGISSPAWASTYFKLDRHGLENFQKEKLSFEKAGTLPYVIDAVGKEIKRIRKASGLPDFDERDPDQIRLFNQLIGKVLACQTVSGDGAGNDDWNESLTIFDDNPAFAKYRESVQNFKGTIEPGKCDDDFYNGVDNGTSESLLKSGANFDTIFQPASQGTFVHAQKANFFLEQIIFGHDQLKLRYDKAKKKGDAGEIARSRTALERYRKIMYEKMSYVAKGSWKQGTAGLLVNVAGRCTDIVPGQRSPESKDPMIYALACRGMFPTPEELKKILYGIDTDFNKNWTAQVKEFGGIRPIPID